jgi:D-alanine-D-alanine ligase
LADHGNAFNRGPEFSFSHGSVLKMADKQRVAVLFGGRSPEHDVSIVTGLQALEAIDSARYEAFAVYVSPQGEWLYGEALAWRNTYLPDGAVRQGLDSVTLDLNAQGRGVLLPRDGGLFRRPRPIVFDVALLAFHGTHGEDGGMQGLFEVANVPYTGMRTLASAVLMDKAATKRLLGAADIPLLPHVTLTRPQEGLMAPRAAVEAALGTAPFPAIVKPNHLGSSIGVAKVNDIEELLAVLPQIFKLDPVVIVEPYVSPLVEYNVAVSAVAGTLRSSAIECPKRVEELLDFKQKYLSGGGHKSQTKQPGQMSQGMLSLTRDLNPKLPAKLEHRIRGCAERAFVAVGGTGAPRIDFLCNSQSGEIWLNEINPCPGSFGFFLWEAVEPPILFTHFLTALIDEALAQHRLAQLPADPVPHAARLFRRP